MLNFLVIFLVFVQVKGGHWEEQYVCEKGSLQKICVPDSSKEQPVVCELENKTGYENKVYLSWNEVEAKENGTFLMKVAGVDKRLPIMVTKDGRKYLIVQRRIDGSVDFYRGWNDYELGFGDLYGEFWIGLRALNFITTSESFRLAIFLEDFNNKQVYATYNKFIVSGPETKYKLQVGGYNGTAGDSLEIHDGMSFSTYDNDYDWLSGKCAEIYHGAWWYRSCHASNLNGRYYPAPGFQAKYGDGINWFKFRGYYDSMKTVIMALTQLNV